MGLLYRQRSRKLNGRKFEMQDWIYLVEKVKWGDLGAFDVLVISFRDMWAMLILCSRISTLPGVGGTPTFFSRKSVKTQENMIHWKMQAPVSTLFMILCGRSGVLLVVW
jgi:hypothetical protein